MNFKLTSSYNNTKVICIYPASGSNTVITNGASWRAVAPYNTQISIDVSLENYSRFVVRALNYNNQQTDLSQYDFTSVDNIGFTNNGGTRYYFLSALGKNVTLGLNDVGSASLNTYTQTE